MVLTQFLWLYAAKCLLVWIGLYMISGMLSVLIISIITKSSFVFMQLGSIITGYLFSLFTGSAIVSFLYYSGLQGQTYYFTAISILIVLFAALRGADFSYIRDGVIRTYLSLTERKPYNEDIDTIIDYVTSKVQVVSRDELLVVALMESGKNRQDAMEYSLIYRKYLSMVSEFQSSGDKFLDPNSSPVGFGLQKHWLRTTFFSRMNISTFYIMHINKVFLLFSFIIFIFMPKVAGVVNFNVVEKLHYYLK